MTTLNVEQLVKAYIKMRDARQQLQREFDEADDRIKQQQEVVQQALLELCKETGTDGLKTSAGTVTRTVKTRYWTSDWNSMKNFIKEHDTFSLMQQRINNTNMTQFLEENPELCPPGLNAEVKQTVTIIKR